MELEVLATLKTDEARAFVSALFACHATFGKPLVAFEDQDTCMVIRPRGEERGSTHYMFFSPGASQRMHYHPSVRYLVLIGDSTVNVSTGGICDEEAASATKLAVGPGNLVCLRISPREWHSFDVEEDGVMGVIAFSVHGDDLISDEDVDDQLMTEVTVFADNSSELRTPR